MISVLRVAHVRSIAWAWLACALLAGCNVTPQPPATWVRARVAPASDRVLWEVTALALEKSGFPVGSGFAPGSRTGTSGWRMSLAPFRGKGYREQCEVRFTEPSQDAITAEVRVRREKNDDVSHPLDPSYAQWKPDADNDVNARIVLQYIVSMLGSPTPPSKKLAPASAAVNG